VGAIVAVGIAGAVLYPSIPDPTPVHWDAAGAVDGWVSRSFWSVFGTLVIGLVIVGVLHATSYLSAPGASIAQRHLLVIGCGLAGLSLCGWFAAGHAAPFYLVFGLMVAGVLAVVIVLGLRLTRLKPLGRQPEAAPAVPAIAWQDDPHWRAGFLYVSGADRRVLVPKRYGLGWTINFGTPGGAALGIAILLLLVAAAIVPLVVR